MGYRFGKDERERLEVTRTYLLQQLHQSMRIGRICTVAIMSRHKLNAGFEKYYGQKVMAYLTRLRMEKARELLLQSEENIAAIADACGYAHPENFSAAYKRYWNCSPRTERKKPE